jgi:YfiH family protein
MQTGGFVLRGTHDVPYYACRAFENLPWLRHGFSTRLGGANEGTLNLNYAAWDAPGRVNENRRLLLSALGLENANLVSLHQIHSNRVYAVESTDLSEEAVNSEIDNYEGDALVTNVENAALAIKTADCFPVLLADPIQRIIGAVHSGWRGTLTRVLPCAIEEMSRRYQSNPAHMLAAIGPGIRECCFETGEDVARLFTETYPEKSTAQPHPSAPGKYLVNLAAVLKKQLTQSGVPPENQHDSGMCTCCNTREFFSWRAEGAATGRMMAVISISK